MNNTRNAFLIAIAVIAILGIGVIVATTQKTASITAASTRNVKYTYAGQKQTLTLKKVTVEPLEGARFIAGQTQAPFTVVEFADYQCPACGVFATENEGLFETEFVSSGQVRYAYRDFPLSQHANANAAAQYAACAADQDRFPAMKAILFRAQSDWSASGPERAAVQFSNYASQIGIDVPALESCVKSGRHQTDIRADLEMGRRVELEATPSFVINGYLVSGALPPEAFRAIFAELKKP